MTKVLLSLHVLAAIVAIGPVTVAASMFPAAVRRADWAQMRMLHRICRVYAVVGLSVPVFGFATAASLGVLTDAWLLVSIALTAVAAVVLAYGILPAQAAAAGGADDPAQAAVGGGANLVGAAVAGGNDSAGTTVAGGNDPAGAAVAGGSDPARARRLGMVSGVFNLLWATVVVLMIVRPGSTTGA